MKPILYYDEISPPVRSVLLLIEALHIEVDLIKVDLFKNEQMKEDFQKLNPMHTVPTLKHDDLVLTDSQVILIYLAELYDKSLNLYPKNSHDRIIVLNRLFFNSSFLFRRDSDLMTNLFKYQTVKLDDYSKGVYECYDILETYLATSKFMACDYLTLADYSIVTTLSTLNILFPVDDAGNIIAQSKWSKLIEWFRNMKTLNYYNDGNQLGIDNLKYKIKQYCTINK